MTISRSRRLNPGRPLPRPMPLSMSVNRYFYEPWKMRSLQLWREVQLFGSSFPWLGQKIFAFHTSPERKLPGRGSCLQPSVCVSTAGLCLLNDPCFEATVHGRYSLLSRLQAMVGTTADDEIVQDSYFWAYFRGERYGCACCASLIVPEVKHSPHAPASRRSKRSFVAFVVHRRPYSSFMTFWLRKSLGHM